MGIANFLRGLRNSGSSKVSPFPEVTNAKVSSQRKPGNGESLLSPRSARHEDISTRQALDQAENILKESSKEIGTAQNGLRQNLAALKNFSAQNKAILNDHNNKIDAVYTKYDRLNRSNQLVRPTSRSAQHKTSKSSAPIEPFNSPSVAISSRQLPSRLRSDPAGTSILPSKPIPPNRRSDSSVSYALPPGTEIPSLASLHRQFSSRSPEAAIHKYLKATYPTDPQAQARLGLMGIAEPPRAPVSRRMAKESALLKPAGRQKLEPIIEDTAGEISAALEEKMQAVSNRLYDAFSANPNKDSIAMEVLKKLGGLPSGSKLAALESFEKIVIPGLQADHIPPNEKPVRDWQDAVVASYTDAVFAEATRVQPKPTQKLTTSQKRNALGEQINAYFQGRDGTQSHSRSQIARQVVLNLDQMFNRTEINAAQYDRALTSLQNGGLQKLSADPTIPRTMSNEEAAEELENIKNGASHPISSPGTIEEVMQRDRKNVESVINHKINVYMQNALNW